MIHESFFFFFDSWILTAPNNSHDFPHTRPYPISGPTGIPDFRDLPPTLIQSCNLKEPLALRPFYPISQILNCWYLHPCAPQSVHAPIVLNVLLWLSFHDLPNYSALIDAQSDPWSRLPTNDWFWKPFLKHGVGAKELSESRGFVREREKKGWRKRWGVRIMRRVSWCGSWT